MDRRQFAVKCAAVFAAVQAFFTGGRARAATNEASTSGWAEGDGTIADFFPEPVNSRVPWTHLEFNDDPQKFHFAITADITGNERPGVWEDALQKINLLQPAFAITIGDLIEGYVENEYLIRRSFEVFDQRMKLLKAPFFYVAGNHDISNETMAALWRERYGREYYHFVYKGALVLCLQSNDGPHYHLSAEQIAYFREALAKNQEVRWTLVFVHDPLWTYDWDTGWSEFESMLGERPYTVFAGHIHLYAQMKRNGRDHYILATTGGASTLAGAEVDGQFDHVMWVTMTDDGPVVLNLKLDGLYAGDVRSAEMPAVREQLEVKRKFMEAAAKRMGGWKR